MAAHIFNLSWTKREKWLQAIAFLGSWINTFENSVQKLESNDMKIRNLTVNYQTLKIIIDIE